MDQTAVKTAITKYLEEVIVDDEDVSIETNTMLVSDGVLDSISTLRLVDFLEKEFDIEFEPHEVDKDNLDSVDLMAAFILEKKSVH